MATCKVSASTCAAQRGAYVAEHLLVLVPDEVHLGLRGTQVLRSLPSGEKSTRALRQICKNV